MISDIFCRFDKKYPAFPGKNAAIGANSVPPDRVHVENYGEQVDKIQRFVFYSGGEVRPIGALRETDGILCRIMTNCIGCCTASGQQFQVTVTGSATPSTATCCRASSIWRSSREARES